MKIAEKVETILSCLEAGATLDLELGPIWVKISQKIAAPDVESLQKAFKDFFSGLHHRQIASQTDKSLVLTHDEQLYFERYRKLDLPLDNFNQSRCRLCLKLVKNSRNIFGIESELLQIVKKQVKMSQTDGLSQALCETCFQKLKDVRRTFEQWQKSQTELLNLLVWEMKGGDKPESASCESPESEEEASDIEEAPMDDEEAPSEDEDVPMEEEAKFEPVEPKKASPRACVSCPKTFKTSLALNIHSRVHSGVRPFTCDTCSKSFKTSSAFVSHKATHSEQKPYICSLCNYSGNTRANLRSHQKTHSADTKPFHCNVCSSTFSSSSNLSKHMRNVHQGVRSFTCKSCPKAFSSKEAALKHGVTHSNAKIFGCPAPDCSATYAWYNGLQKHLKAHHAGMKSLTEKQYFQSHVIASNGGSCKPEAVFSDDPEA